MVTFFSKFLLKVAYFHLGQNMRSPCILWRCPWFGARSWVIDQSDKSWIDQIHHKCLCDGSIIPENVGCCANNCQSGPFFCFWFLFGLINYPSLLFWSCFPPRFSPNTLNAPWSRHWSSLSINVFVAGSPSILWIGTSLFDGTVIHKKRKEKIGS